MRVPPRWSMGALHKDSKKVLNALVNEQVPDDEVLSTFMYEAQSVINSRPLTYVSDDVRHLEPLTPNRLSSFGTANRSLLESLPRNLCQGIFTKGDRLRWRQVQHSSDVFWRRWIKEYLPTLQERQTWFRACRNFQIGDTALLTDEKSPKGLCPLARIISIMTNHRDRLVRSVTRKTKSSTLERPIDKIVLLEGAVEVAAGA